MDFLAVVVHHARSDSLGSPPFPSGTPLGLAVRVCVTGSWQDALRADLALCNADKDALRGEVASAAAAITVLQCDRVRACKLGGGGGWLYLFLLHGWTPFL